MDMRPAVTYTPFTTSSRGETGNISTFAQFEEGGILTKTHKMQKAVKNPVAIQLFHHY